MAFLKKNAGVLLSALFVAYAVFEKFMLPEFQIPMIVSIIYVAACIIIYQCKKHFPPAKNYARISCVLFAFFFVIGDSFKKYGSFFGVWGNPFKNTNLAVELLEDFAGMFVFLNGPVGNALMLLNAVAKGIGYYFIIFYCFEFVKYVWFNILETKTVGVANRLFSKNKFVRAFLTLVILWLPYLIIKFPGAISVDAYDQIQAYLNNTVTTHHPYLTTLLYGGFAKLGILLGNMDIGIFAVVLFQYIAIASAIAYCISKFDDIIRKPLIGLILLLFFGLSPLVPSYATTLIKDNLYITLFLLYVFQIILILYHIENEKPFKKNVIALSVISLFVCLTRNNGIYIVIPTALCLALYILIKGSRERKKVVATVLLVLPVLLYYGFNFLQYDVIGLERGSIREALSIPFQQTARYVKEHPEDVTEQEAEIINRVLDYDNLAELYNPIVSDPVKATYKEDEGALKEYFGVWFKHLKRHPVTYIEATVNTNYFAFYPDEPNIRAYIVMGQEHSYPSLKPLRIMLLAFCMGLSTIPVVTCIINPVFFVWIFIYLGFRIFSKKDYKSLLIMIPLLIQLATVIAGPAVFNHPRYLQPIVWVIPFIALYFIYLKPSNNSESFDEKDKATKE